MKTLAIIGSILIAFVLLISTCSVETTPAASSEDNTASEVTLDCWQGNVLKTIYNTIGILVMDQFDNMTKGSMSVMMIGFAVWVAIRLLKFVSSVREDSPAQIWNEILQKAFICVLCGSLAYSSGTLLYFINSFLFPIYAAFLNFGNEVLWLVPSLDSKVTNIFGKTIGFLSHSGADMSCEISQNVEATMDGFPTEFSDTMNCMICNVVDKMKIGRGIALQAMEMNGVLPYIVGLLLWLVFIVIGFGFVFYLVDSIFRFGMMIMLLPIFIMAYAFGPTKKWTGIGFTNIMNSAAFMMAFCIIIATAMMAVLNILSQYGIIFNPPNPELHLQNASIAVLSLLLIGFLIFGSLGVAQQLTSVIIGGKSDSKFQQDLKAVGHMFKNILLGGMGWVVKRAGLSQRWAIGRFFSNAGALRGALDRLAGRDH